MDGVVSIWEGVLEKERERDREGIILAKMSTITMIMLFFLVMSK